ncbi:pre-rRNA-processing protein ESF2 [Verticillium alfalfae VaMs.102]|uniref:Pre-rRNA-processing protein ESF2 n=1 Tax=Verticillium alfalfae (strain VaMs.102 / ATCC MYA-4576 / FGSC 10136) TaxID=526221 RepID=C9STX2_VERA1|nr:pre-rRNA-processing protein ESF2 [Verticillium alfalfae VaMs.102]EEY22283.1 pre-rRNA-processing protein ESF2 [Verticillium alfalfae VaMs.102]
MAPEKRNEFLDAEDSDDDQSQGYDSEAENLQKGGRTSKRRKVDESDDEDILSDNESVLPSNAPDSEADDDADNSTSKSSKKSKPSLPASASKALSHKNLIASEAAIRKSGVVYLSRIPPYMKPHKLRTLLTPHGALNRIFLAPEDPAAHTRRVRARRQQEASLHRGLGRNSSNKKDAKRACELLNARPLGRQEGVWNNLTEQIAGENAERTSRMRAEIARTTKENKEFVANIERAKVIDGVKASKEKKRKRADGENSEPSKAGGALEERPMTFKQVSLAKRNTGADSQPEHVTRVLSKIF